jgi:hypothetical protein
MTCPWNRKVPAAARRLSPAAWRAVSAKCCRRLSALAQPASAQGRRGQVGVAQPGHHVGQTLDLLGRDFPDVLGQSLAHA